MDVDQTKVRFKHWRKRHGKLKRYRQGQEPWTPDERGGMTVCVVLDPETGFLGVGHATCDDVDAFCYATGREMSFERALGQFLSAGMVDVEGHEAWLERGWA